MHLRGSLAMSPISIWGLRGYYSLPSSFPRKRSDGSAYWRCKSDRQPSGSPNSGPREQRSANFRLTSVYIFEDFQVAHTSPIFTSAACKCGPSKKNHSKDQMHREDHTHDLMFKYPFSISFTYRLGPVRLPARPFNRSFTLPV